MTHDPQAGTLPAFPCPAAPYLPHDPPMALIDRVLAFGEDHIQASAVLGTDAGFDDGSALGAATLCKTHHSKRRSGRSGSMKPRTPTTSSERSASTWREPT